MYPRLVADIGGTNARFALASEKGQIHHRETVPTRAHDTPASAIRAYLEQLPVAPVAACLAIACPVSGDEVRMTNHHWHFSIAELRSEFGWKALHVMNDFEAIALALPHLDSEQGLAIGGGQTATEAPRCVLGPGTGLGVAMVVPHAGGWIPVATEGGHASLAPGTEEELAVFHYWLRRGLSLSREHFLSGPGLLRIYRAHCDISGEALRADDPARIYALASEHDDAMANEALELLFALLGSACGDQALATGARGGVYLAGGILPRMRDRLRLSRFRARFEDKPPMEHYVRDIPTTLVTEPDPGLVGAAHFPMAS